VNQVPANEVIGFDQDMPIPTATEAIRTCSKDAPAASPETTRESTMTGSTEMLDLLNQINGNVDRINGKVDRLGEESTTHTRILEGHTRILEGHSRTLEEHGRAIRMVQEDISIMRSVLDSHTHLLHKHDAALQSYTGTLNVLLQDTRLLRIAINRLENREETVTLGGVKVLPEGLIKVLNDDLNRLQHQVSELMARVEMIEARHWGTFVKRRDPSSQMHLQRCSRRADQSAPPNVIRPRCIKSHTRGE
jgi:hypothetical protein